MHIDYLIFFESIKGKQHRISNESHDANSVSHFYVTFEGMLQKHTK